MGSCNDQKKIIQIPNYQWLCGKISASKIQTLELFYRHVFNNKFLMPNNSNSASGFASPTKRLFIHVFTALILVVAVTGCRAFREKPDEYKDFTAEQIYYLAKESMGNKNWDTAIDQLRLLEARYPYGIYSEQAQLDTIYAYYRKKESGLAITAAERFIKLHPAHDSVDYAYYLKALSTFDEDKSLYGYLTGQHDLSDRDATNIRKAMLAFEEVYDLFPNSKYGPDARKRVDYLRNAVAKNEIAIANYYYSRAAYVAVVNRAKGIIENYPTSSSMEQALALLMFSYENMGFDDLASDARRVLELNYAESEYLSQKATTVQFSNKYSPKSKKQKKNDEDGWFSSLFNRFKKDDPES